MAANLNMNDSSCSAAGMEDSSKRRSSRSIKRRKFDDELVESSLGAAFGSPLPKTPRTRTQSLNMTPTSMELHGLLDPDFVVVSLADEQTDTVSRNITNWAKSVRSPLMAIDPPSQGTPSVVVKYSLVPALPLSYSESNGKIYLCNMGIPTQVFHLAGIQYKSPFGSKSVIPLHINE